MATVLKCLLVMGVCVGLQCCSQQGQSSEDILAEAEATVRSEAAFEAKKTTMIRVLGLNASEALRLGQAFDARYEAIEQFLSGEAGQRLITLEAELRVAAQAKDLAAVQRVIDEAQPLRDAFCQRIEEQEVALYDVLTPAQATHWQGYEVAVRLLETMGPVKLSAEQMVAISEAGPPAFYRAQEAGEVNPKAAAFLQLERWAESDVLSPEQRDTYEAIKGTKGLRSLGI